MIALKILIIHINYIDYFMTACEMKTLQVKVYIQQLFPGEQEAPCSSGNISLLLNVNFNLKYFHFKCCHQIVKIIYIYNSGCLPILKFFYGSLTEAITLLPMFYMPKFHFLRVDFKNDENHFINFW